jgi:hypothetical protein
LLYSFFLFFLFLYKGGWAGAFAFQVCGCWLDDNTRLALFVDPSLDSAMHRLDTSAPPRWWAASSFTFCC